MIQYRLCAADSRCVCGDNCASKLWLGEGQSEQNYDTAILLLVLDCLCISSLMRCCCRLGMRRGERQQPIYKQKDKEEKNQERVLLVSGHNYEFIIIHTTVPRRRCCAAIL